jgi:rubredoxin
MAVQGGAYHCIFDVTQVAYCALQFVGRERKRMRKWQCIVCGWIYDEAEGYQDEGIAPGTAWSDVPDDFVCPECGVSKEDFEMIEVG